MIIAMSAMVFLTMIIGLMTLMARINSVRDGSIKPEYFKVMNGDAPDAVVRTSRAFTNQFEIPVLFYIVTMLTLFLMPDSALNFYLAWAFVFSRYVHAYIHLSYNHVIHRMLAFLFGFACVMLMWLNLLIHNFF